MNVDACIEMLEYESGWEVAHAGRAEEVEGGIVVKDEDGSSMVFWTTGSISRSSRRYALTAVKPAIPMAYPIGLYVTGATDRS